jgi:hypothetical protein
MHETTAYVPSCLLPFMRCGRGGTTIPEVYIASPALSSIAKARNLSTPNQLINANTAFGQKFRASSHLFLNGL